MVLSPPTDSLPKFCAVLGLAIILGAFSLFYSNLRETQDTLVSLAGPTFEKQGLTKELNALNEQLQTLLGSIEKTPVVDEPTRKNAQELLTEAVKLKNRLHQLSIDTAGSLESAHYATTRTALALILLCVACVTGGILSWWGFVRWARSERSRRPRAAAQQIVAADREP